jgi:hypothetical protein
VGSRLRWWFLCILLAIDQLAQVIMTGPGYVVFGGVPIDPDETVSSWVGRRAAKGNLPARYVEIAIDFLFGKGHCRDSIGT